MNEIIFSSLYPSNNLEEPLKNRFTQISLGGIAVGAAIITAGIVGHLALLIILGGVMVISATTSIYYLNKSQPSFNSAIGQELPTAESNLPFSTQQPDREYAILLPQEERREVEPIFLPPPAFPIDSDLESGFPTGVTEISSRLPNVPPPLFNEFLPPLPISPIDSDLESGFPTGVIEISSPLPNDSAIFEELNPEPKQDLIEFVPSNPQNGWSTRRKIVVAAGIFATASLVYYLWQSSFESEEPTSQSSNSVQSLSLTNALDHLWTTSSHTAAAIAAAVGSLFNTPTLPVEPIIVQTTPTQEFPIVPETLLTSNDAILPRDQILAFTSYTKDHPARLGLSLKASENQRAYCDRNGYDYHVFEKNLAAPSLPYWSKIAGIRKLLETAKDHQWIVWLDDDALIANPNIQLNDFILEHGGENPNTHVIVTTDIHDLPSLNTGVLMVRISETSRKFFSDLWNMRTERLSSGYTYGDCPNQSCLHEQQAMEKLLERTPDYLAHVARIPQRDANGLGMNVFLRTSHYDFARNMFLDYNGDPKASRFKDGDFIVQCTGLATNGEIYDSNRFRELGEAKTASALPGARNLRERCIDLILTKIKTLSHLAR